MQVWAGGRGGEEFGGAALARVESKGSDDVGSNARGGGGGEGDDGDARED